MRVPDRGMLPYHHIDRYLFRSVCHVDEILGYLIACKVCPFYNLYIKCANGVECYK